MAKNDRPTQEQIEAAQETLRRAAQAEAEERQARIKPISDITGSKEFQALRKRFDDLPAELANDPSISPHLVAIRTGLNGLNSVAPVQAPEPQA